MVDQVANYGVGGQYEPHYDFSRVSLLLDESVCVFGEEEERMKYKVWGDWTEINGNTNLNVAIMVIGQSVELPVMMYSFEQDSL